MLYPSDDEPTPGAPLTEAELDALEVKAKGLRNWTNINPATVLRLIAAYRAVVAAQAADDAALLAEMDAAMAGKPPLSDAILQERQEGM